MILIWEEKMKYGRTTYTCHHCGKKAVLIGGNVRVRCSRCGVLGNNIVAMLKKSMFRLAWHVTPTIEEKKESRGWLG